jgi:hypothetical protein
MPLKGFKSITVKADVYDYLMEQYKKEKKEYLVKQGINSFAGYVTYQLAQLVEAQKKQKLQETNP